MCICAVSVSVYAHICVIYIRMCIYILYMSMCMNLCTVSAVLFIHILIETIKGRISRLTQ